MKPSDGKGKTSIQNTRLQKGTGRIDVVSCGIGFPADPATLALLEAADTVYGSRALLTACPVAVRDARIVGAKARQDAADALALSRSGRRVAVLASGDALYHGFGGTLAERREDGDDIVYHPGITAFQTLFHRLGLPWQDARLFCAHSGERLPAREIAEAPLSVTYAGTRYPADAIARAVLGVHPASGRRAAVTAERLGSDAERIRSGSLEELARTACGPTSILVVFPSGHIMPSTSGTRPEPLPKIFPPADAAHAATGAPTATDAPIPAPILALGLPEEDYERENNLITASDVRAVILSRLRLPAWGTLWDIGAGSGSVGLEAAALRPNLAVHGVERKPERGAIIERNRLRMGLANYTLHLADALEAVRADSGTPPPPALLSAALPAPDRIFVGGGGKDLPALLTACLQRLQPGGIIAASAVTLESLAALLAWSPERRTGLCRLDIANERPIAGTSRHLKPQNTIYVFTFQKETTI